MNERPREFGDVPGYEFDGPRAPGHTGQRSGPAQPRRQTWPQAPRPAPPADGPAAAGPSAPSGPARTGGHARLGDPAQPAGLGRNVLAAMRGRNLFISLALPLLAAITVGIAVVVVIGANNSIGTAPAAIAAGFPPARVAAFYFGGGAKGSPVQLSAIAAAGATQVVAGSAGGGPGLWVSADGGSAWRRGVVTPSAGAARRAGAARPGSGQLAWVAHGASGWLAVGDTTAGRAAARPVVLASPDGLTWTATGGTGGTGAFAGAGRIVTAAVAAGEAGYVIVGHAAAGPRTIAAAWYAPGLTGWRRAADAQPGALDGPGNRRMAAVTAAGGGFAAVGAVGANPAAWLSGTGRAWTLVTLPLPAGAASAALDYVAANGATVAAVGTEVTTAGLRRPFDAISADAGATWTVGPLPLPGGASAASVTAATALTAAGGGFTATGTYGLPGETDVVVWTLPARAAGGTGWTAVAPQGTGLAGPGTQAITALTATGATLTGVGFTTATASATATEPTIWQSPVRS